jgi:hypothetical protein
VFAVIKNQWQQYKFRQTVEAQALRAHTQTYFSETILHSLSRNAKNGHIQQFLQNVSAIMTSQNPFLAFREQLGASVTGYAELQVLCLKPHEKADVHDSPYISGELYPYIRQCKDHVEWIDRLLWEQPTINDDDLIATLNARCVLILYHSNGPNILRGLFEHRSLDDPKDWFKPFVRSMLISAENTHRQNLKLPSMLGGEELQASIRALKHATFLNGVVDGAEQPLFAWERHYNLVHSEVS